MMLHCVVRLLLFVMLVALKPLLGANIGLLVVATGKYIDFVEPLVNSGKEHFCKGHKVTFFVFTDSDMPSRDNIIWIKHQKIGWPYDTLLRFKAYYKSSSLLQKQDYLFACDADMLFVDTVGDEILSERVATISPGFYNKRGSFETNPASKACVYESEASQYFAGGFYGGTSKEFLHLCQSTTNNIEDDLTRGIIAVWHDESHLNRYFIDHPPTKILTPAYCYPEHWDLPFEKRLLALDKNHTEYRQKGGVVQKPIVIVVPSRNNEEWCKKNINSILDQQYTNFRVIYLDDASTDQTKKSVINILKKRKIDYKAVVFDDTLAKSHQEAQRAFNALVNAELHTFTYVTNHRRAGGLCNIYRAVHSAPDEAIIVTCDGDDWLFGDKVLTKLNEVYSSADVWYTHGTMMEYPSCNVTWNEPLGKDVIASHAYRKVKCPTHLRTFYAWLFKKIRLEDLLYDGKFYPMAWDLAMMLPMAEMAAERHAFMEFNYVYNMATSFNDNKVDPALQNFLDAHIRNKKPYKRLKSRE